MYLAMDTSRDTANLVLVSGNKVLAESTWYCCKNQTSQLLPQLMQLLYENNSNLQQVRGIIVAIGPGSFNGLRVGVSTAKGLAFGLDVPLVGINTLYAESYQYHNTGLPVCPIFNAGREEIITATYQKKQDEWCEITAQCLINVKTLCSQITEQTIFCGDLSPLIILQLAKDLGQKAVFLPTIQRATSLAWLGLVRLKRGDVDNPDRLQPMYSRQPQITKPKTLRWGVKNAK